MSNDKTATERLRELLDELRKQACDINEEEIRSHSVISVNQGRYNRQFRLDMNHEWLDAWHAEHERILQAIAATLGREQGSESVWESDPVWEQWLNGLKHDEIKTIGDAVEQLMYETIEHGGDMGPNGNTYGGIDEGEVLTLGFINDWIEKFEGLLEHGTCTLPETRVDHGGIAYNGVTEWHKCSACGEEVLAFPAWYCPNCGAKVVD